MSSQSALPEYPCARVRGCKVMNSAPPSCAARRLSRRRPRSSKPLRSFTVTAHPVPATPRATAAAHDSTSRGSRSSDDPAPLPVTTLAGQPQLRSTRGAPPSLARNRAHRSRSSSLEPMSCAARRFGARDVGGGVPSASWSHSFHANLVQSVSSSASYPVSAMPRSNFSGRAPCDSTPGTRVNSRHASSNPPVENARALLKRRSPNPSIGARKRGGTPPLLPRSKSAA